MRLFRWNGMLADAGHLPRMLVGLVAVVLATSFTFMELGFAGIPLPGGQTAYLVMQLLPVAGAALLLGNTLFGGSSNAKLFMTVREQLSLCYYASSGFARSKRIMTVSSGIEVKDYDRALAEILHQLDLVRQGQWEPWELESARAAMDSALTALSDSQGAMENYCLSQNALGLDETPEELLAALQSVTRERIMAAACAAHLDTVYFLKGKEETPC